MKCRLSLIISGGAFRTAWLEITSREASFGCGVLFAGAKVRLVKRLIALHGHPVAPSHGREVIKNGVVLNAAVVPEGDRVLPPSESAAKLRPLNVLEQKVEDRLAGIRLKFLDAGGEASIHIESGPLRFRMGPQHRMLGNGKPACTSVAIVAAIFHLIVRISRTVDVLA